MGRMNSRAVFLFSVLIPALILCAHGQQADHGTEADLDPGVPFCGHISPSSSDRYFADIEPHTSEASFLLRWRSAADSLDLVLRSPSGRVIGPGEAVDKVPGETFRSYLIEDPEAGRWTVDILSSGLPEKGDDYCLSVRPVHEGDESRSPPARFNGLYSDYGVDEDGDGLDEYVVMKVGLNIRKAGDYSVEGSLYDPNDGREIPVSNTCRLGFGSHGLELQLSDMRTPGPYRLKGLVLYDENGDELDRSTAGYITEEYPDLQMSDQETRGARLNGDYSDYVSDIDGDGFFDYLTVDVGLDVFSPDNYSLMGFLCDASGKELVWSMGFGYLVPGTHKMHVDFDGKTLWQSKVDGPYHLCNLSLSSGDSVENLTIEDITSDTYITAPYDYAQFVDPVWPEKTISGSGFGEVLLTISVESSIPVFEGRYSYDIVGAYMPPISSNWTVNGSKNGYAYDLPGVHMPGKPNDFTIVARDVKNLNMGVRKEQSAKEGNFFRSWVSAQTLADNNGTAVVKDDRISPGKYQFKVFGDAADNATSVALELKVVKKLVINGDFTLSLNTDGFPPGNYSISVRAINGSLMLDEMSIEGPSMGP
jgi:hypothetical protein